jgi:hypothetical protein
MRNKSAASVGTSFMVASLVTKNARKISKRVGKEYNTNTKDSLGFSLLRAIRGF